MPRNKPTKKEKENALAMVKADSWSLDGLSEELKKDPDVVREAVKHDASSLSFADPSLKKDQKFMLDLLRDSIPPIGKVKVTDKPYQEYEDNFKHVLMNADQTLKIDKEFILKAIEITPYAFQYADPKLQRDKSFILEACNVLEKNRSKWDKNPEAALEAVKINGLLLQFADPELKKDRALVELAVRQDALAAVRQNGLALEFVDDTLKNDPTFFWKVWNINSDEADEIRASYTRKFLLKEVFKFIGGAGLAITGGLMLGSIIALPLAPLAVLIGGVIAAIGALITLHTVMRLHTVAAFKEQLKELKNTDEARKQQPDEANGVQVEQAVYNKG